METISRGSPFSQYQFLKKISASSSPTRDVVQGRMWTSEPKRSVSVTMQSKPSSTGNGPIKLIATESHHSSGTGKGCSGPMGFVVDVDDLFL